MQSSATIAHGNAAVGRPSYLTTPGAFPTYAWSLLGYNLLVILWGAFVRATGSGAGCGGHWPLCNGEVLPTTPQVATMIEFVHRAMSGVALVTALILAVWGWKAFPAKHPARRWSMASLVFMLTEALIGAALVLLGHVARNESVGRVVSLSLHLVNTFALLASLTLAAWWSTRAADQTRETPRQGIGRVVAVLAAMVLVAMAGVITALGDTLFPAHSLSEGIASDFAATASFLIRLRAIHPAIAIATAALIATIALHELRTSTAGSLRTLSKLLLVLLGMQILIGTLTFLLRAPLPMQLAHLFTADALWITLVLFASEQMFSHRPLKKVAIPH